MKLAEALALAPPRRAPRRHDEDDAQAAIVEFLRTVLPAARYRAFAVPNGGARSKAEAARMKRTGTLAGVFDVCILGPSGGSFWLETKAGTGRLSQAQRDMREWMDLIAVPHAVVRSIGDVRVALRSWGLETREAA